MNKNVLITGVGKGIGKAIAERFLKEGYNIDGTYYMHKEEAFSIKKHGSHQINLYGPYDFTNLNQVELFLKIAQRNIYDAVVLNAGIFEDGDDFNDFDLERFNRTMNCNFYANLILGIGLKNNIRKGGTIVLVSSNDVFSGSYSSISYNVSKMALISLSKCLATNYGGKGIRVNAVAPGAIDTDMNTAEQLIISPLFTPIGRVGTPCEVANCVFFLSSPQSSFISGTCIPIDGGYGIESVLLKSEEDSSISNLLQNYAKSIK